MDHVERIAVLLIFRERMEPIRARWRDALLRVRKRPRGSVALHPSRPFFPEISIEDELEAMMLDAELDALNIPHAMISHYSSAFDGLFQVFQGWGHVEAPSEFRDEILTVLENLRLTQCHDEHRDEDDDSGREGQKT